jgi:hypothetical protein
LGKPKTAEENPPKYADIVNQTSTTNETENHTNRQNLPKYNEISTNFSD